MDRPQKTLCLKASARLPPRKFFRPGHGARRSDVRGVVRVLSMCALCLEDCKRIQITHHDTRGPKNHNALSGLSLALDRRTYTFLRVSRLSSSTMHSKAQQKPKLFLGVRVLQSTARVYPSDVPTVVIPWTGLALSGGPWHPKPFQA